MDDSVSSVCNTGVDSSDDSSEFAVCAHRPLTAEEQELLKCQDARKIPERRQNQLEKEARKHWDLFYKRNSTKFFKDRHWTLREFQELSGMGLESGQQLTVLEVGCGVGNFMFPLLSETDNIVFHACDFSPRAIQFVKENPQFDANRCHPFCCDVTSDSLTSYVAEASADLATVIFCLSAIHPSKMVAVLENIYSVLRPGGCVLVRDYGLYDHAMLRFAPGHKLADSFYVRQDGTRAYYFSKEKLDELFSAAGYRVAASEYIYRRTVNRKEEINVQRVFVQGRYVKPSCAVSDV